MRGRCPLCKRELYLGDGAGEATAPTIPPHGVGMVRDGDGWRPPLFGELELVRRVPCGGEGREPELIV